MSAAKSDLAPMPLPEAFPTGRPPVDERALCRRDWVEMGLRLLVDEGIDAVKITRLAQALGVTRGSFYWHFKDRADLLDQLLDHWQRHNTAAVVAAAETAQDLTEGILALFDAWIDADRFDPRLDSALRDWARQTPRIKTAVAEADQARVAAFAALYQRAGYEKTEAFIRARILYFAQVGYYALNIEEPDAQRISFLESYFKGFTGRDMDPARAAAHRAKFLAGAAQRNRSQNQNQDQDQDPATPEKRRV